MLDRAQHRRSGTALRRWYAIHKWTSLVSTLFLLMLAVTGLPLVFHEEIDHALGYAIDAPARPGVTAQASLDEIVSAARARKPGHVVQFVSLDDDTPGAWFVSLAETPGSIESSAAYMFDSRTGAFLHEYPLDQGVMHFLFEMHAELFAGLPGTLLLGVMGVLLVASLVSGVVVYGPFMSKLPFGSLRFERAARIHWLDLHNLLGIVTLVWLFTVGLTGVVNTLARPIFGYWQATELVEMTARYKPELPALPADSGSAELAVATARRALPDMELSFLAFPGTQFATPQHFVAFMQGNTPLTSRLLRPVLIDAQSGALVDQRALPWYVSALLLSQPLHFGDYGGIALKIVWALLDLLAVIVLGSGVYLWLKKRNVPLEARLGLETLA
jgi:uncharacterized iron-regulated membrane protein